MELINILSVQDSFDQLYRIIFDYSIDATKHTSLYMLMNICIDNNIREHAKTDISSFVNSYSEYNNMLFKLELLFSHLHYQYIDVSVLPDFHTCHNNKLRLALSTMNGTDLELKQIKEFLIICHHYDIYDHDYLLAEIIDRISNIQNINQFYEYYDILHGWRDDLICKIKQLDQLWESYPLNRMDCLINVYGVDKFIHHLIIHINRWVTKTTWSNIIQYYLDYYLNHDIQTKIYKLLSQHLTDIGVKYIPDMTEWANCPLYILCHVLKFFTHVNRIEIYHFRLRLAVMMGENTDIKNLCDEDLDDISRVLILDYNYRMGSLDVVKPLYRSGWIDTDVNLIFHHHDKYDNFWKAPQLDTVLIEDKLYGKTILCTTSQYNILKTINMDQKYITISGPDHGLCHSGYLIKDNDVYHIEPDSGISCLVQYDTTYIQLLQDRPKNVKVATDDQWQEHRGRAWLVRWLKIKKTVSRKELYEQIDIMGYDKIIIDYCIEQDIIRWVEHDQIEYIS